MFSTPLSISHPELSKQWHPSRNESLTPNDVTKGSHKIVWWKCPKGDDHEWLSTIRSRTQGGRGCPFCAGKRVSKSNSLAVTHPEIAKQWHPSKNGSLTPNDVSKGSHKVVWWKCPEGDDHEWQSAIKTRVNMKTGCSVCANHTIVKSNSLTTLRPNLAKQWHETKNGDLTPEMIGINSSKKVWWKCPEGDDHEWLQSPNQRQRGEGCPICTGKIVVKSNCLATSHPELASEWHPSKNGDLTPFDISYGSGRKVWWKCPKGDDHEWIASPNSRAIAGNGCLICAGYVIVNSNCLATLSPEIAKEWHPTKNDNLTPHKVGLYTHNKVWWLCQADSSHEWEATVANRVSKDSKCPYCYLTPQSRQELLILFELKSIFPDINPRGYKIRMDGKLHEVDLFIKSLNLIIEFDGYYWHKNRKAKDVSKTKELMGIGYDIIRIREHPLEKLFDNDIMFMNPFDGKIIVDDILKRILNLYTVDPHTKASIDSYIKSDVLLNGKSLDNYISYLLRRKANNIRRPQ